MIKRDILENRVKTAYLAVGSSLGNKNKNIELTKIKLSNSKIKIIKCSSIYESLSWPNPKNPTFFNIVLKVETFLSAKRLLKRCLVIEKELGRKRKRKNEPRVCDIDILDYDNKIIFDSGLKLTIPHSELHKRSFVLLPLFEISKNWIHPKKKIKITKMLNSLAITDLTTIKQI